MPARPSPPSPTPATWPPHGQPAPRRPSRATTQPSLDGARRSDHRRGRRSDPSHRHQRATGRGWFRVARSRDSRGRTPRLQRSRHPLPHHNHRPSTSTASMRRRLSSTPLRRAAEPESPGTARDLRASRSVLHDRLGIASLGAVGGRLPGLVVGGHRTSERRASGATSPCLARE